MKRISTLLFTLVTFFVMNAQNELDGYQLYQNFDSGFGAVFIKAEGGYKSVIINESGEIQNNIDLGFSPLNIKFSINEGFTTIYNSSNHTSSIIDLKNNNIIAQNINSYRPFINNISILKEKIGIQNSSISPFLNSNLYKLYYINNNGSILFELPENYSQDVRAYGSFYEGLARIAIIKAMPRFISRKLYGFVNNEGAEIIEPQFSGALDFSEGLVAVSKIDDSNVKKWGFINSNNETIINFNFSNQPTSFSEGLSRVENKEGEFGFIDKIGKVVIPPTYQFATGFVNDKAIVKISYREWAVINKKNEILKKLDKFRIASLYNVDYTETGFMMKIFNEGYAPITYNGKVALLNKEFNIIEMPDFQHISDFSNGLAYARYRGKDAKKTIKGFINTDFEFVIVLKDDSLRF